MTSSPHGPYELGYTCATMIITIRGNKKINWSKSRKIIVSSDYGLKLVHMKLESLVIAKQHVAVNIVTGLCTYRPSHQGN
jgi:hypothetical protein